jgi:fluoride exporter
MPLDPAVRVPIAISLGAIGGALSRYYLTQWMTQRWGTGFPYGTFFINISGCFLMGAIATLLSDRGLLARWAIAPELRLMATTGFLGAYTTFSTYGLDTMSLLQSHRFWLAGWYWLGSAGLGILALQVGIVVARSLYRS